MPCECEKPKVELVTVTLSDNSKIQIPKELVEAVRKVESGKVVGFGMPDIMAIIEAIKTFISMIGPAFCILLAMLPSGELSIPIKAGNCTVEFILRKASAEKSEGGLWGWIKRGLGWK